MISLKTYALYKVQKFFQNYLWINLFYVFIFLSPTIYVFISFKKKLKLKKISKVHVEHRYTYASNFIPPEINQ